LFAGVAVVGDAWGVVTHDCAPSYRVVGEIHWTIIILYVQTIFSVKQINVFFL
jgi:hypothetical protein